MNQHNLIRMLICLTTQKFGAKEMLIEIDQIQCKLIPYARGYSKQKQQQQHSNNQI